MIAFFLNKPRIDEKFFCHRLGIHFFDLIHMKQLVLLSKPSEIRMTGWMFEKDDRETFYLPMLFRGYYGWKIPYPQVGKKPLIGSLNHLCRIPSGLDPAGFSRPRVFQCTENGVATVCTQWKKFEDLVKQMSTVQVFLSGNWWISWEAMRQHLSLPQEDHVYTPFSYSPSCMKKMMYGLAPFDLQRIDENRLMVKKYFDHQFKINSLNLLSCLPSFQKKSWVSKYQIQLLWRLSKMDPCSISDIMQMMHHWKETQDGWIALGSPSSRVSILEQLQDHGWMEILPQLDSRPLMKISKKGHRVLELLAPEMEDEDLPWRLEQWKDQGFEKSHPEINAYLLHSFEAQWFHLKQKNII